MKTKLHPLILLTVAPVVTALVLATGCGKSDTPTASAPPEVTDPAAPAVRPADEPVAAPAPVASPPDAGQWTRFGPKPGLQSKVRIEGTSTMHDWQVESPLVGGTFEAGPNFPLQPGAPVTRGALQARANVFIPVGSLKSLKKDGTPYSTKMDDVMYEKLLKPVHSRIVYQLHELTLQTPPRDSRSPYVFDSLGELAVAGVTNLVTMPIQVAVLPDRKIKISGTLDTKMSAYKIEPPALTVLGVGIKTGDDLKLFFEWEVVAQ